MVTPEQPPPAPANGTGTATPNGQPGTAPGEEPLLDDGLSVGSGCSICGGGNCTPPDWYTEQGVRFFGRTNPRLIPVAYAETVINGTDTGLSQVFTDRSQRPGMSVAYDLTLGHYFARNVLDRDHFVEFSFWGLNRFEDEAAISATQRLSQASGVNTITFGNLYSPYAITMVPNTVLTFTPVLNGTIIPGFNQVDQYSSYYASYMNNFEINGRITPRGREDQLVLHPDGRWRRECQPGRFISYLYGVRFMQLDEVYRLHGQGVTQTFDPTGTLVDSVTNTGDYNVVTHNNLLGLQIGADMMFRECRWSWGLQAKVGPYVNFADQASDIAAGPEGAPTFTNHLADARHNAALIAELGFVATYKFRPNLVGRASYDFMWASGLALAPEQLQYSTTPVTQINTNGTVVFNGPSLGLEWLW